MPALVRFFLCILIVVFTHQSFAVCKDFVFTDLKRSTQKNDIIIYTNAKKSVTLAVRCQNLSVSKSEAINEFAKTGPYTRINEDTYFNEIKIDGVISRNYLLFRKTFYQMSLVVRSKNAELNVVHQKILDELKNQ